VATSQTSVLPQSLRGPQMVHYAFTVMRQAAGAHSSGIMVFFGEIDRASSVFGGDRLAPPVASV
jgi:hypothetical protein